MDPPEDDDGDTVTESCTVTVETVKEYAPNVVEASEKLEDGDTVTELCTVTVETVARRS